MPAERDFGLSRFEAIPGYRDPDDSPFVVVPDTSTYLDLYLRGQINNRKDAEEFLNKSTFPYLERAKRGLQIVSGLQGSKRFLEWGEIAGSHIDHNETENIEALGYMVVIFGFMPETPSDILPKGFSRSGNLSPPQTITQYSVRIEELRVMVSKISQGQTRKRLELEYMRPPLMRTVAFFRTGSWLPLRFPDGERDYAERKRAGFDKFLGDIDVSI